MRSRRRSPSVVLPGKLPPCGIDPGDEGVSEPVS